MTAPFEIPQPADGSYALVFVIEVADERLAAGDDNLLDELTVEFRRQAHETLEAHRQLAAKDVATRIRRALDAVDLRGFTWEQLRSSDRRPQTLVRARQDIACDLRDAGLSYLQIGKLLARDHSTVISNVRQARARRTTPCEECGDPSMADGRWCLRCFQQYASGAA
jgi:chromosomal replication initiation ATPase DnaA